MIGTERLILRVPADIDRADLHAMWADAEAMRDLGPVKSAADSDATLARHAGYAAAGLGFRAVIRRVDGATIGFCGLKPGAPGTPVADDVEAGWMIARPHWRQGYALEAMRALLDWGWANTAAPRIVAITARRNAGSRAVMQRLGMMHDPVLDFLYPGRAPGDPLADIVTYVLPRP